MADTPPSSPPDGATPAPLNPVQQGWTILEQTKSSAAALEHVADITEGHANYAQAQHLRGVCAVRDGDALRGKTLLIDAIHRGEATRSVWQNLAVTAAQLGSPDDAVAMLLNLVRRLAPEQLAPVAIQLLRVAGFNNKTRTAQKDAAFLKLALPILSILLERGEMDGAMAAESLLYETQVKPTETEAHFAWCMDRIAPLFTAAAHRWREDAPVMAQPSLTAPYNIGFFIHNASMLAHIEVLLNTLKGYRMLDEQPFEPTVYCFGGKSAPMERALADLGVRLVMLNERFPETQNSGWQRLLRLRELLAQEGVQELVWVSLVTMLPLAFGMRLAPVQTWWAMKYRNFSNVDIDGYVTGSALTRYGTMCGRLWRMGKLGVDDWYDPTQEVRAAEIRASFPGRVIGMTLARDEKMRDPAYLKAMCEILAAHPDMIFLWAGRQESPQVTDAFRAAGVLERTHFVGWVNTRLYVQVADVFLDTFPFPCGFTLFQAMAAGKPVLIYDSPEAAQTGLWNFLRPLVDGDDGTPEERAELRSIIGDEANPLIPVARSPEDYVRHAGRLIRDPALRAAGGEAAKRFVARYYSDPRAMGESLAEHFVELIEERRVATA